MNTLSTSSGRSPLVAAVLLLTLLMSHTVAAQSLAAAQPAYTTSGISGASATSGAPQIPGGTAPTDIHDIRGPSPIPSPWLIPLIAVTVLLATGGGYFAWAWNRRRYRNATKRPLDIALERLDEARPLMTPSQGREFSIEVSSTVRDYIESRFDLRAAHLTTHEFLHQLLEPANSVLTEHRSLLDNFLQTCDLAKFGGWNLAATDMEAMLESARRFIVASASASASADESKTPQITAAAASANRSNASISRETYVSLPST